MQWTSLSKSGDLVNGPSEARAKAMAEAMLSQFFENRIGSPSALSPGEKPLINALMFGTSHGTFRVSPLSIGTPQGVGHPPSLAKGTTATVGAPSASLGISPGGSDADKTAQLCLSGHPPEMGEGAKKLPKSPRGSGDEERQGVIERRRRLAR
jgi:hypothetical protein